MANSYKYPPVNKLYRLIRSGRVPADIDIEKAVAVYIKRVRRSEYSKMKRMEKPRFFYRASAANSRAKRLGAEGTITEQDLEEVYAKHNGKCAVCGKTNNFVFDHIIPYYRNGTNTKDNLQLLCRICNMEKGVN